MSLTLVIGGTRSGKSDRAETLARATGLPVRYVATAEPSDPAMADRIRRHAARRPADWSTVEAGPDLSAALADASGTCVLVDGLGPWIATELHRAKAFDAPEPAAFNRVREQVMGEVEAMASAATRPNPLIVVAEEAGQGVLPPDLASRAWLDLIGEATQRLAGVAERVELVVAGRALALAGGSPNGTGTAELRAHGDAQLARGLADHAVNVLGGGPPEWLRAALHAALDSDGQRYPDEGPATAALAALHGRYAGEIVPTNGASEALWLLPAALRPTLAAVVHPAFGEAEAALSAHGVPVTRVPRNPERGFALDPTAVPDSADLVVVGNPASPSGTLDPAAALLALRRPGRVVAVDEAFMDLVPGEPSSLVREPLPDVIVVRSMTKSMALPGVRAGYAVAPPELAERLRSVRPPWSANAVALAALTAIAQRPQALAEAAERAAAERSDLADRLDRIAGVRTWPGVANFCLVEVADGPAVAAALRERGIAVRPAASFPGLGSGHLRITARGAPENERLARALAEVLG